MFVLNLTEELRLKQLESRETSELFGLIESCRGYLRRWLKWIDTIQTLQDVERFIRSATTEAMNYRGLQVGIWFRGELAGLISYDLIDWKNRSANIGAWLGENFQGQGIMIKSGGALVDYAFGQMHLNRVEVRCGAGNFKSQALPERFGFKKEGILREAEWLHDRFIDQILYGMTRKDYYSLTGSP